MEKKCLLQEFCIYIKQTTAVCQAGWNVAHMYLGSLTHAFFPEVKEIKSTFYQPGFKAENISAGALMAKHALLLN